MMEYINKYYENGDALIKVLADISSEFNVCRNFQNCKTNVLLQYPDVYCYKCEGRGNKIRYSGTSILSRNYKSVASK